MLLARLQELREVVPATFSQLTAPIDPEWVTKALATVTGGAEAKLRNRKLPVVQALWLVIGMALFRDRSISAVVGHLGLVLPDAEGSRTLSPGAISPARKRLGARPLETLFELSAAAWSAPVPQSSWRGLSIWALDGTCFSTPFTAENVAAFGRPANGLGKGQFPKVRVATLMNAHTHVMAAACVGGYDEAEIALAKGLFSQVPDHSLTIVDRGLQSPWVFYALTQSGTDRHWLTRVRADLKCELVKKLGRGDEVVEITLNPRSPDRVEGAAVQRMPMRRIRVQRKGYKPVQVLTSLMDPERWPAAEVAGLYARRWEVELAYDEVKTHQLEREDVLRSQTPEGIRQEVYGILLAYNLVRVEMARIAAQLGVVPTRLSFRQSVVLIRNFLVGAWLASPGNIPKHVASFEGDLKLLLLPPRRARRYPRVALGRRRRYRHNPRRRPTK